MQRIKKNKKKNNKTEHGRERIKKQGGRSKKSKKEHKRERAEKARGNVRKERINLFTPNIYVDILLSERHTLPCILVRRIWH